MTLIYWCGIYGGPGSSSSSEEAADAAGESLSPSNEANHFKNIDSPVAGRHAFTNVLEGGDQAD